MITRVTHMSAQRNVLANMQNNLSAMVKLQEQGSSGKLIGKVSDDPAKASDALTMRRDQKANEQFVRNAEDGRSWLNLADSALATTSGLLLRARDLVVQGSNTGTMNSAAREALAAEIDGIKSALLDQANTKYLGRSIFAGTSGTDSAFDGTDYTFSGVPGASVERRTSNAVTIRVDTDGASVFGSNTTDPNDPSYSVFKLMEDISNDLRAGNDPQHALNKIDTRHAQMTTQAAAVGARTNQIERALETATNNTATLKNDVAGIENIDLAQTIMDLKLQEVAYTASLNASARVLQPTLLDYLR
ncbi:flagellar hook-associated protein FlgL [Jonesiaceae bacterium BS-20]|uniref:Flagellar hook-associated protein FlgL n=1 Tax=Jonesiaceae bacterium BS-20 TaxID=3120821 RepID=A0AAU7DWN3_9MICO